MKGREKNAKTQARCHNHVLHRILQSASPKSECDRLFKVTNPANLRPVIPDISRELPVISDLFPDHNILPGHLLGIGSFSLQTVHPDLPCSGMPERLDVKPCQLRSTHRP